MGSLTLLYLMIRRNTSTAGTFLLSLRQTIGNINAPRPQFKKDLLETSQYMYSSTLYKRLESSTDNHVLFICLFLWST
jgi:hypothetical protein